jgi:2'-5' RNA ligase
MPYDYGGVMASGWPEGWESVLSAIDRHDVYSGEDGTHGIETNPHVTVLYGLHEEVHEDLVCRMCQGVSGPLEVSVEGVSLFEKDDYDVLKLDVDSSLLRKMNRAFRGLPHTNKHGEYKPHMTVAYLKSGHGSKYVDKLDVPDSVSFSKMQFTPKGAEEPINISI